MMTGVAVLFMIVGAGFIGLGQRTAASREDVAQILGIGVVLFFGGVALVSFRLGDRAPVVIISAMAILVLSFVVTALRRR